MTSRTSQHTKKRTTRRSDSESTVTSRASRQSSARISRTHSRSAEAPSNRGATASRRSASSKTASRQGAQASTSQGKLASIGSSVGSGFESAISRIKQSAPKPNGSKTSRAGEDRRQASRTSGKGESSATNRTAAREERKRKKTKERAGKMFDRQMAQSKSNTPEPQGEGAPRAALYEGRMGATHRRSARMQRAGSAGSVSAKANPVGWFSGVHISKRSFGLLTAAFSVLLVAVFLYTPAQQYYQAQRSHDQLTAEYAQIMDRNQVLDEQNDALASDAGMEDAVRQKYGYVVKGDQPAIVTGLSDETLQNVHGASDVEANVLSVSVKAPEEWYTPLLDAFFGVK